MKKNGAKIILFILIALLILVNYSKIDGFFIKNLETKEKVYVERVIDGDTIVINGTSARLLGINTPERGEYLYSEAKFFLESKTMNKTIYIERYGKDRYDRDLVYVYDVSGENINIEIVKNGYANYYFPEGKDRYYYDFLEAWENCINSEKRLCEKSKDECAKCISIEEFGYNKNLMLKNTCNYNCDLHGWKIKDEGRKDYIFENVILKYNSNIEITEKDFGEDYVWTKTGDTVFVRDSEGKLVAWEGY